MSIDRLRDDLAVTDNHHYVRRERAKVFHGFRTADSFRLIHGNSRRRAAAFTGEGAFPVCGLWAVGLRHYFEDAMTGGERCGRVWEPQIRACRGRPASNTSLPFARLLQLFDFALNQVAFECAQMAEKKDAVQVIDFVQHGPREQIFAGDFEPFAF